MKQKIKIKVCTLKDKKEKNGKMQEVKCVKKGNNNKREIGLKNRLVREDQELRRKEEK